MSKTKRGTVRVLLLGFLALAGSLATSQTRKPPQTNGFAPCVADEITPGPCRVRLATEVKRDGRTGHYLLTVTTTNISDQQVVVQESNPRVDVDLSVVDAWRKPTGFTEKEIKLQKSPFNRAAWRNFPLVLGPADRTDMEVDLSDIYSFQENADYTITVSRVIYGRVEGSDYRSENILEVSRSRPLLLRVPFDQHPLH